MFSIIFYIKKSIKFEYKINKLLNYFNIYYSELIIRKLKLRKIKFI